MSDDVDVLITRYLDGVAEDNEVVRLEHSLHADPALRQRFVAQAALLGLLAETLRGDAILPSMSKTAVHGHKRTRTSARSASRPWPRAFLVGALVALMAGVTLWFTHSPDGPPSAARMVVWDGDASLLRHGARRPLISGQTLVIGDRLDAGTDGSIDLAWTDGSRTRLTTGTRVEITDVAEIRLDQGDTEVRVQSDGRASGPTLAVRVGDWRIIHLGTTFTVSTKDARLRVHEGRVAVHRHGQTAVTVLAGQAADVDAGGHPHLRWDLPAIPYGVAAAPFSSTSRWNAPIGIGTPRKPFPAASLGQTWSTTAQRVMTVVGTTRVMDVRRRDGGDVLDRIPGLPAGVDPAGIDFLVILSPRRDRAWEVYGGTLATGHLNATALMSVDLAGDGMVGMLPSGLPACAGLIQGDEPAHGIHHALSISLPPATLTATGLRIGDHVALAEEVPLEDDPVVKTLGEALRRHGAIVVGSTHQLQLGVDSRLSATIHQDLAAAMTRIAPRLQHIATP